MTIPDTYGWDTVFAIDIDEVNRALATLPASRTYSVTLPIIDGSAALDWAFGNWRITDTPGGNQVEVTLDFEPGSALTMKTSGDKVTRLDGWSCSVLFAAHFDEIDPVTHGLKARTATGTDWASVNVRLPAGLDPRDYFNETNSISALLRQWFDSASEAVALFDQEFATVNIGADLAARDVYYLQPLVLGFAGAVMADGITKALGILAMTRDSPPGKEGADPEKERKDADARARTASLQLSPYAIMPNAKAGFVVSSRVFLEHMMKPACASTYGVKPEAFEVHGADSRQLRNAATLSFKQKLDGVDRAATISAGNLNLAFDGDKLRLTITAMHMETAWPGFTLSVTLREAFMMSLVPKADKDDTIFMLNNVDAIDPDIQTNITPGVQIATAVVGTVLAVAGAALGVMTVKGPLVKHLSATAAKYVARIIAGAAGTLGAVIAVTPQLIEAGLQAGDPKGIPGFQDALNVGLARISWPGRPDTKFVPVEGHFANAMVVTINPRIA